MSKRLLCINSDAGDDDDTAIDVAIDCYEYFPDERKLVQHGTESIVQIVSKARAQS